MRRVLVLAGTVLLGGAQATGDSPEALLQRTKTITATYTTYSWLYQRDAEGERKDTWVVEMHSGDWHRGENAQFRAVTNCRTHKGWAYNVRTGETTVEDTQWIGACGISTGNQIVAVDRLEPVRDARFGLLQTLRVTDRAFRRYYTVDARGVIVRGNWVPANGSPAPCIQSEPVAMFAKLPAGNWFTPLSLKQSAVPALYKVAPKGPAPIGLSGRHC